MKRNLSRPLPPCWRALALPAHAANIVDEWASVKAPAAPALKPVTVDPKTTALLMLDFMNQNCGKRPRCVASIPAMKKLLDEARAAKVTVVYRIIAKTTTADVHQGRRAAGRASRSVLSGPDKFLQHRSRENPQGQGHQDRDRGRHGGKRRGAVHRQRRGVPRHECDRAGRRHVGGRSLRRIFDRLFDVHERAALSRPRSDADAGAT